jgi:uncharacterized membrane protein
MPHSGAVGPPHPACVVAVAALARPVPLGPGYSVLLVAHVAAAVVGFGALATTGLQAARARRGPGAPGAEGVRRYFEPGVNWPARALYGVPVLGFALAADSNGAVMIADGWVVAGLLLWLAAAAAAEAVVWPGERRIQAIVSEHWDDPAARAELDRTCRQVASASAVLIGVFVAAVVLMVAKP